MEILSNKLETWLAKEKASTDYLITRKTDLENQVNSLKERSVYLDEVLVYVQECAKKTQQQIEFYISDIVSDCIKSTFDKNYTFKITFETRRNKTEAVLSLINENGVELNPEDACGGGMIDIISFALRVAVWSITKPKTRSTLILDEPFKNLSREYKSKASILIKEVSSKLGIQIIMVSHEEELIDSADTVFRVSLQGDSSKVQKI